MVRFTDFLLLFGSIIINILLIVTFRSILTSCDIKPSEHKPTIMDIGKIYLSYLISTLIFSIYAVRYLLPNLGDLEDLGIRIIFAYNSVMLGAVIVAVARLEIFCTKKLIRDFLELSISLSIIIFNWLLLSRYIPMQIWTNVSDISLKMNAPDLPQAILIISLLVFIFNESFIFFLSGKHSPIKI